MMDNFGTYIIITKPTLPHRTIAQACVACGVKMLQLREKHLSDTELLYIAKDIRSITKGTGTNFVINDRPDIAVMCDADFLHLGQDDLPLEEARKIVGPMRIGLSTHSLEQARQALSKDCAYIGFGPIHPTNAKATPDEPVGVSQLEQVISFTKIPVVAIGGIFPENLDEIVGLGARNIAMVRYFMQAQTKEDFISRLNEIQSRLTFRNI